MAINFPNSPSVGDTYQPPGSPFTYTWSGIAWIIPPGSASGGGTGEANIGANVGSPSPPTDYGNSYQGKNGVALNFRSLRSSDASVAVTTEADNIDLTVASPGVANTGLNMGAGAQVYKDTVQPELRFRSLISTDASLTITPTADTIDLEVTPAAAVGEANDGANIGAGVGLYAGKTGVTLDFNTISAANGLNSAVAANNVALSVVAGDGIDVAADVAVDATVQRQITPQVGGNLVIQDAGGLVQDGGFAISDVARLSQTNTFAVDQIVTGNLDATTLTQGGDSTPRSAQEEASGTLIANILSMSQAAYDGLSATQPDTLYIIV